MLCCESQICYNGKKINFKIKDNKIRNAVIMHLITYRKHSGFTYSLNNNTSTTRMTNAITQTMKNRATATRFVLAQGTHQAI